MPAPTRIAEAAKARIRNASATIATNLDHIRAGAPLDAEPDDSRKVARIATLTRVNTATAVRIAAHEDPAALGLTGEALSRAEAIQGKTVDYLGVAWLEAGFLACKAVARILLPNGVPEGTGFLISDRLLITNNHVIPTAKAAETMFAEFGYEIDLGKRTPAPVRFRLDPKAFFETDDRDDLDYTVVALGAPLTSGTATTPFGRCPLSAAEMKHTVGEPINIVEHPDGDYKQVVVRENRLVHRGGTVLHYLTDTEPGSSGSPVFNDQWQVVALHHWGGPHREVDAGGQPLDREVNEGIRISAIVGELKERSLRMDAAKQALLKTALEAPPPGDFGTRVVIPSVFPVPPPQPPTPTPALPPAPGGEAGGAPANRIDPRYSNRRGYNSRFLPSFSVPMPQLSAAQQNDAARRANSSGSSNPFELKYEHFSVVVNARRRMPFFSICNIDGAARIRVNRDTGRATSGPEASENWALDPRIPAEAQLDDAFYRRLKSAVGAGDFFARGHMTRREDPCWGTAAQAERANDDTFHHTNACPQVQNAFNGSHQAWQGIENFLLDTADDADVRITVITGPIFTANDPVFRDPQFGEIRIPRQFWKIVAYTEQGVNKAFAILADQGPAMDAVLARIRAEAIFEWPNDLSTEYQSTIAEITRLTGLDFGNLGNHDIFIGREESLASRTLTNFEELLPRRAAPGDFGSFPNIAAFLEAWEGGAERRRPATPARPPAPRERRVAEIHATVERVFADDLSGAKHQQFTVIPTEAVAVDPRAREDVANTIAARAEVRLAVRFGDNLGLAERIPGIRTGVPLRIKGEWIPASEAARIGGEQIAVLHFTHDPLGFVCTEEACFS
ncbi:MAG: DNA/RNA non-specific endonuclease [Bryobacteraceae bacterium]